MQGSRTALLESRSLLQDTRARAWPHSLLLLLLLRWLLGSHGKLRSCRGLTLSWSAKGLRLCLGSRLFRATFKERRLLLLLLLDLWCRRCCVGWFTAEQQLGECALLLFPRDGRIRRDAVRPGAARSKLLAKLRGRASTGLGCRPGG